MTTGTHAEDVFLLGAGFSKSISDRMPTLRDLGESVLHRGRSAIEEKDELLRAFETSDEVHGAGGLDIERLMTFLSQDQPFLRPEESAKNRSTFLRLSSKLAADLGETERAVTDAAPPTWLLPLIRRWEQDKATVATFNYDTLIERGYRAVIHEDFEGGQRDRIYRSIYAAPTYPADARRGFTWSQGAADAFAYLKMHGSLNWFYSGAPSYFGEPVYELEVQRWGLVATPQDIAEWTEKMVRRDLPDKIPLVIPPTTDKSIWFTNELVRSQWLMLGESLRHADRVIAVGYSLPPTDSLVHALLATTCIDRDVVVVNTNPDAASHYARLLPAARIANDYAGVPNAVEAFASDYL